MGRIFVENLSDFILMYDWKKVESLAKLTAEGSWLMFCRVLSSNEPHLTTVGWH